MSNNNLVLDDRIWDQVLEALSQGGRLSRLYKLPTPALTLLLKKYGHESSRDLAQVFSFFQSKRLTALNQFLESIGEERTLAMLHTLIRCMRCWVETESTQQTVRRRWRVANA